MKKNKRGISEKTGEGWTGREVESRFGRETERRERLIRREKEWEEDRGTVTGGDREGGEGEKEGLGQGGMRGKKETKRDCGIMKKKKNKSGRRRETGMTFKREENGGMEAGRREFV